MPCSRTLHHRRGPVVDIHSHILWGVDDGPSTLEEGLAIIAEASANGTTAIVATPHLNPHYAYRPELTGSRIAELIESTGGTPRIYRGCEVHLTLDNVDQVLNSASDYTINGKQYLLVELPHAQIGRHIDLVLRHLLDAGISPIVAHPERNPVLRQKPDMVAEWVELGCLMQLTANSITGGFGASAKAASIQMLDRGMVHIIASDSHDSVHRHPRLNEAYQFILGNYGEDCAEVLFNEHPRDIVEGLRLSGGRQMFERSSVPWWRFWREGA
jgi:protein-tyrosine phosphatase